MEISETDFKLMLGSLSRMERMLMKLLRRSDIEMRMETDQMIDLSNMTREVAETRGSVESGKRAMVLLTKKIEELRDQISNPEDQAKVDALVKELQAAQDDMAAAIAANPDAQEPETGPTGATGSTGGSIGGANPSE